MDSGSGDDGSADESDEKGTPEKGTPPNKRIVSKQPSPTKETSGGAPPATGKKVGKKKKLKKLLRAAAKKAGKLGKGKKGKEKEGKVKTVAKKGGKKERKKEGEHKQAKADTKDATPTASEHRYRGVNVTRNDDPKKENEGKWRFYMTNHVVEKKKSGKTEKKKIRRSWMIMFKTDPAESYRVVCEKIDNKLDNEGWEP